MEGFDAKFEPPLDKRLECPICLLAQREPMQTPCGHRFCSACILRALRETGPRCPVDNTKVAVHQLFKDNFAKREVLSLHVCCHANEQGCKWQGELRKLEAHEKGCGLITLSCPNECGYSCQRKDLYEHLPSCSNQPSLCVNCSISFNKNKMDSHSQFCSKLKLPESTLGDILKANEILKWTGHLKMKLHGLNYSVTGYMTAKMDTEERFIHSGCWSSNISLIPLTGTAARIFWKTLQGPEVKPLDLFFNVLVVDSKSTAFQKMIKKRTSAVTGLRPKSSTNRRELTILYIYWSESEKRMRACVAELKNYLVREMQNKLQQLRRTSQLNELTLEASRVGGPYRPNSSSSSGRLSGERGTSSSSSSRSNERAGPSNRRGFNNVHLIGGTPVSREPPPSHLTPASRVLPSILSWQLPPPYTWRATPTPFYTFPSTPTQFLPANSYPYTFAPMPAIAAPPFSINPAGVHVSASIAIPSYAGLSAVPQLTGLHTDLVVSSSSSLQGAQNFMEGPSNGGPPGLLSTTAVIHQFPQTVPDPLSHPNQVSVVVDPRGVPPPPSMDVPITHDHIWGTHQWTQATPTNNNRSNWLNEPPNLSTHLSPHWTPHNNNSNSTRPSQSNNTTVTTTNQSRQSTSPSLSPPLSFLSPVAPPTSNEFSDDDLSSSDASSPLSWPRPYSTPSNGTSDDQSSPSNGGQSGSALQTLADAAALLSSSPHSSSFDETDDSTSYQRSSSSVLESDSFSSDDLFVPPPLLSQQQSNQMPGNHHGNMLAVPAGARGFPPPPPNPVLVPVIHPSVDEVTATPAGTAQVVYTPQEGVILPAQQTLGEVPPVIHVAAPQGGHNIVPVPDPWPAAIVETPAAAAAYIHSRPLLPNGGGFWEDVMPSLDMRLHESHAPQQPGL